MRRRAWQIFVGFSAALLVGVVVLWVRAHQWEMNVLSVEAGIGSGPRAEHRWVELVACVDALGVSWRTYTLDLSDPRAAARYRAAVAAEGRVRFERRAGILPDPQYWGGGVVRLWRRWGFGHYATASVAPGEAPSRLRVGDDLYVLHQSTTSMPLIPWWFLTMLFALAPIRALWNWRRARRRPPHACRACGYDLRATPDATGPRLAACPECGRAAP